MRMARPRGIRGVWPPWITETGALGGALMAVSLAPTPAIKQWQRARNPTSYDAARSSCVTSYLLTVVELEKNTGLPAHARPITPPAQR